MSLQHLNRTQNKTVSEVLIGIAKTLGAASLVTFIYPPSDQGRSIEWLIIGLITATIFTWIGTMLRSSDDDAPVRTRRKKRKGGK